ncbi:hypothetical protein B0H65DRAFT_549394 [Neurospora tetraspora]|uniref:Uncharacterized protein n=1 Tax=Neurospora tetraspora TaxID=94610 RepID=A0AAE0JGJ2_9PEZI|nr:hypothetical protein B0H65DRAFT_549394 [Neurospora tetraspora]
MSSALVKVSRFIFLVLTITFFIITFFFIVAQNPPLMTPYNDTNTSRTYHAVDRQTTNSRSSNTTSKNKTPMERFEAESFTNGPWHAIDGVSHSGPGST